MNLTAFNLYLISRLDMIREFCFVAAAIAAFVAGIVLLHVYVMNEHEYRDKKEQSEAAMPWMKRCALLFTVCALAMTFIPSANQMLLILGVPAVLQSRAVQKDIPELYEKVIQRLLEQLDKPKENVKNGSR